MEEEEMNAVFKKLKEKNKDLKIGENIGKGGFGEVREVLYKEKEKKFEGVGKLIKRKDANETK